MPGAEDKAVRNPGLPLLAHREAVRLRINLSPAIARFGDILIEGLLVEIVAPFALRQIDGCVRE